MSSNFISTAGDICNSLELTVTGASDMLDIVDIDISAFDGYVASYTYELSAPLVAGNFSATMWGFDEDLEGYFTVGVQADAMVDDLYQ